ncbi:nuclear transport factor 2 family protein [Oscillatoriales cyanobacterium LEGE 11467]|uniref:Nuclear transport factor 2 family protein n=1 Tax=Zarconia navalis LEGE 11467 TaxID=1828826 RepID=A0A928VVY1_9CYAN|nr:nuclear transport factor 2 family protein [Zarconia navalis]MBE9041232.1 nuclear transport factor 2 family protein [Zarconia navalis LEGE 11467]
MNNLDIIKTLYQAFENGEIDIILDILDPNVEWHESEKLPYGGTFVGRDAVLAGVFEKIGLEWENFEARVEEFLDAGDTIVALGFDRGTYKTTGKSMQAPTASVWTLKQGKVVKFVQYIDTIKVCEATINNESLL